MSIVRKSTLYSSFQSKFDFGTEHENGIQVGNDSFLNCAYPYLNLAVLQNSVLITGWISLSALRRIISV